jgi:hypothetical protein
MNDGPYTVLGDMFHGLVYNLKHDRKKTEELAPVGRMISVEENIIPDKVVDLPVEGLKQFEGVREDRLNDLTQEQMVTKQRNLRQMEANSEAKEESKSAEAQSDDNRHTKEADSAQQTKKTKAGKKRKQAQDAQAEVIGNPDLLPEQGEEEFPLEVEQDNMEVQEGRRMFARRPKPKQVVQQSYDADDLRRQHVTKRTDRAVRAKEREERKAALESTRSQITKQRAKRAGQPPDEHEHMCAWLHVAPRRKTMLSANLRRVWKTPGEKKLDAAARKILKKKGIDVNAMQAYADIYGDEHDQDADAMPDVSAYTEGVWIQDECIEEQCFSKTHDDTARRALSVYEVINGEGAPEQSSSSNMTLHDRWMVLPMNRFSSKRCR